jgi:hypothetical protein
MGATEVTMEMTVGAADHRFVLGLVSRVVGVTQHASSLQLSQHARLHATGHLRELADS